LIHISPARRSRLGGQSGDHLHGDRRGHIRRTSNAGYEDFVGLYSKLDPSHLRAAFPDSPLERRL